MAALEVGVIAMGWSLTPLKATEALEASSDDDDVLRAPGLAEAHQGDVPGRDDDPGSDYLPDAREEEEEEEVVVEESNGERCGPTMKEHVESLVEAESLKRPDLAVLTSDESVHQRFGGPRHANTCWPCRVLVLLGCQTISNLTSHPPHPWHCQDRPSNGPAPRPAPPPDPGSSPCKGPAPACGIRPSPSRRRARRVPCPSRRGCPRSCASEDVRS